jgi:hypothetical protein
MDGASATIYIASGDPMLTEDMAFDLAGMPVITATYAMCTNQDITFTNIDVPLGGGTTTWDFSGDATAQYSTQNPSVSGFMSVGQHDVIEGSNTYMDFITITCSVDATASQNGNVLTANASSATAYQWIDCATGQALSGETNQVYSPTATGNYAVIVTENNCTDTSECYLVDYSGLTELTQGLSIYPNPVTDVMVLDFDGAVTGTVRIYDIAMKLIDEVEVSSQSTLEYRLNAPKGVYTIELITGTSRSIQRIVKQ